MQAITRSIHTETTASFHLDCEQNKLDMSSHQHNSGNLQYTELPGTSQTDPIKVVGSHYSVFNLQVCLLCKYFWPVTQHLSLALQVKSLTLHQEHQLLRCH